MIQFQFRTMKAKGTPLLTFDHNLTLDSVWSGREDVVKGSDVHCLLDAQFFAEMVTVKGKLVAKPTLRCARCLSTFEQTMNMDMLEMFFEPSEEMLFEEDANIHAVHDDLVVLEPYIEENVSMAIPFAPLCHKQCKGLCPECGINRNEQTCNCTTEKLNPKFAALAKLLQPDSNQ